MFKGRFGDYYLYEIWTITVLFGPILSTFLSFFIFNKGEKLSEELFVFIFIQIMYGIGLCLPSLLISEISYKLLTKSKINDSKLFIVILAISLLTTLLTYYFFWGKIDDYLLVFSSSYSIMLVFGFFYFRKKYEKIRSVGAKCV